MTLQPRTYNTILKKELPWIWQINLQELNQTQKQAEDLQEIPMLSLSSDHSLFFLIFSRIRVSIVSITDLKKQLNLVQFSRSSGL